MKRIGMKYAALAAAGLLIWQSIPVPAEEQAKDLAVEYLKASLADKCPMVTYETEDPLISSGSYTYENGLAALALMSEGDYESAASILDALVKGMENNEDYGSWFSNARMAGKATDLPGYWNDEEERWLQDAYQVGAGTKSNCAAALALLTYYEEKGNDEYLNAAVKAADWIIGSCTDDEPGFTSGFNGWIDTDEFYELTYKTTTDNLWMYAVCSKLNSITEWSKYEEAAETAEEFITENMYSPGDSRFYQGTDEDGLTPVTELILVEPQALAALCLSDDSGLDNISGCLASDGGYSYDNSCTDGSWLEGTAMAALAFREAGDEESADEALSAMEQLQLSSEIFPQAGVPELKTGEKDRVIYDWPSVGPCAWYILAANGVNPFAV